MFDPSKKMDVVVVGGSLAGIMSSIPLLRQGHSVTILERSPTPLLHSQGAGIVAGGETLAFFRRYDRTARKGEIGVTSPVRLYLNRKGEVVDREMYEQRMTSWDLLYFLGRAGFDGMESEYVKGGIGEKGEGEGRARYEYGCMVRGVREVGERVEIEYESVKGSEDSKGEAKSARRTLTADFLIVADGPSSSLRGSLLPTSVTTQRSYAGYVAFRGTVPETELSSPATEVFVERFTFFHGSHTQILAYTIPGTAGMLSRGARLINWVWYWNYEQGSKEYDDLMTDVDGNKHRFTLPTGGTMQPRIWDDVKQRANNVLPPQFAELVEKTTSPFVQAITDLTPPPAGTPVGRLLGGKAVIVGDALSGFRPHTAASTGQAALHALLLEEVFGGRMGWEEYEDRVLRHAKGWQERGVALGTRSQFGRHPMAEAEANIEVDRKDLWMRK